MSRKKKRVVMGRLVPRKSLDRSFDLIFWKKVGVQGRFEAAWEMVRELVDWNPRYGHQQRLRRSIASLKLRSG